ncbi:hypothetical protein HYW44_03265, partial [Candidatus Daviesbacteria bacterium]|nr:hypothetical protein [Candidatus Daviesbacteria bacterium]
MKQERAAQVEKDPKAGLLSEIFVRPMGLRDDWGVKLRSGEAIGVATEATLSQELKLLGMGRDERRGLTLKIARMLKNREYKSVLPLDPKVWIETSPQDFGDLFYRSDLRLRDALERHKAYANLLQVEVEALQEARSLEQKQREEGAKNQRALRKSLKRREREAKIAATARPSSARILVFSVYSPKEFKDKVEGIKETAPQGEKVEVLEHDFLGYRELMGGVIDRRDVLRILEKGMSPEEFKALIPLVRMSVVSAVEQIEEFALPIAGKLLAGISDKIERPGRSFTLPILTPRAIGRVLTRTLSQANENPNITVEGQVMPLIKDVEFPYMLDLIEAWNSRLDFTDPIQLEDRDSRAKKLLPDDLLTKAIFADVAAQLYPMPYVFSGHRREIGFVMLRYLADNINTPEAASLLVLESVDNGTYQHRVREAKDAIAAKAAEVESVRGGKDAAQRKKTLEAEHAQLVKELRGVVRGSKSIKTISGQIKEA